MFGEAGLGASGTASGQPLYDLGFGPPPAAEDEPAPQAWWPAGKTRLDALVGCVPHADPDAEDVPWRRGCSLAVHTLGGAVSRDRERYTLVGRGSYQNFVSEHRDKFAGSEESRVGRHRVTVVSGGDGTPEGVRAGRDYLHVKGDAQIKFRSRSIMMRGQVEREYAGGVLKITSMEGVIAGGGYLKTFGGAAAHLSAVGSGDVYGGAARAAATRIRMALLHYRAASGAAWACGIYTRTAAFVIEPMFSVPETASRGLIMRKLFRMAKLVRMARMVMPALDIALGLILLIPLGIIGIAMLIKSFVSPQPIPPLGPPGCTIASTSATCPAGPP